ncbi:uncharacterized protein EV422DRAFT_66111 [Fimicolochytrium jonesii]|uniref:uncharacterized protein n=1 Tax=Fimicolochytrium jonesii TaxID=1396493 RepID=UPI0022FE772B|nr:uncharacterized protein EV422DRAFT_66111 [Fimicolochytrium jonesii]KAI8820850.1 hypothetical protein EV422DRAFT_66111 [Fimicolochytrium jonesii]
MKARLKSKLSAISPSKSRYVDDERGDRAVEEGTYGTAERLAERRSRSSGLGAGGMVPGEHAGAFPGQDFQPCRMTIGVKMALLAVLLTMVSVGLMAAIAWISTSKTLTAELEKRIDTIALLRSQHLTQYIMKRFGDLNLIASRLLIQGFLKEIAAGKVLDANETAVGNRDLATAATSQNFMLIIEFLSLNGSTVFQTVADGINMTELDRRFELPLGHHLLLPQMMESVPVDLHVSERPPPRGGAGQPPVLHPPSATPFAGANPRSQAPPPLADNSFVWGLIQPIHDATNLSNVEGYIRMMMRADELAPIIYESAGLGDTGQLVVVKAVNETAYRFILPPMRNPEYFPGEHSLASYPLFQTALQDNKTHVGTFVSFDGSRVMGAMYPVGEGWYLASESEFYVVDVVC